MVTIIEMTRRMRKGSDTRSRKSLAWLRDISYSPRSPAEVSSDLPKDCRRFIAESAAVNTAHEELTRGL